MIKGLFEILTDDDDRQGDHDVAILLQTATMDGEERIDGYWADILLGFHEYDDATRLRSVTVSIGTPEAIEVGKKWLERMETEPSFTEVAQMVIADGFEAYTKEKMAALMAEE